jgi:AraC-like DNA-binding protein
MVTLPDPIREWREQYARRIPRVDFEPSPDSAFHASVKPIFRELRVVRAALSPGFLFRDEDLLRDGDDSFGFVVAQSREITARHLGREVRLAPGDATVMTMGATGGVGWRESFALFDMLIPRAEWEARGARPQDVLMRHLRGKSEVMQLLRRYIGSLERSGLTAFGNDHAIVRRHIIDLAVLATTARCTIGESDTGEVVAARLAAALDYIASHFSDAELSLTMVARSLRISPRYLQRLLESAGTTFTAHVTELWLKQTFMMLTAQSHGKVRISDIALQSGFSDISHFNRLFRSRFGATPTDVHAQSCRTRDQFLN